MPELHPIFYIGICLIVVFFALAAWIAFTPDGRDWLYRLQLRTDRLERQNRGRKWPTFPMEPERTKQLESDMRTQRINSNFDAAEKSLRRVIRDPAKLDELLKRLEVDRQRQLADKK